jgi:hypothetical protein
METSSAIQAANECGDSVSRSQLSGFTSLGGQCEASLGLTTQVPVVVADEIETGSLFRSPWITLSHSGGESVVIEFESESPVPALSQNTEPQLSNLTDGDIYSPAVDPMQRESCSSPSSLSRHDASVYSLVGSLLLRGSTLGNKDECKSNLEIEQAATDLASRHSSSSGSSSFIYDMLDDDDDDDSSLCDERTIVSSNVDDSELPALSVPAELRCNLGELETNSALLSSAESVFEGQSMEKERSSEDETASVDLSLHPHSVDSSVLLFSDCGSLDATPDLNAGVHSTHPAEDVGRFENFTRPLLSDQSTILSLRLSPMVYDMLSKSTGQYRPSLSALQIGPWLARPLISIPRTNATSLRPENYGGMDETRSISLPPFSNGDSERWLDPPSLLENDYALAVRLQQEEDLAWYKSEHERRQRQPVGVRWIWQTTTAAATSWLLHYNSSARAGTVPR